MKKYCVLAAVGAGSLHREWIGKHAKFDLHLIVYDDFYEKFRMDTPFISESKGYKFKLIYGSIKNKGV